MKLWRPVIFLVGAAAHNKTLLTTAVSPTEFSYKCRFCNHHSHQNLEFCPQCGKDDYGNKFEKCVLCKQSSNAKYKFCPYCGNKKVTT